MPSIRVLPYVLIVAAGIIWGSTFSLAILATQDGTHPLALSTWQAVLCALVFAAICVLCKVPFLKIERLRHYMILAVVGIVAPNVLYYNAAPHLSAGILSITVSTVPLFTYALMWAMRFEPMVVKRVLGIVLGMIAILLLVLPDQGLGSGDASLWILLVVLCALFYAVESVYISEGIDDRIDIRELLSGSNIIAAFVLVPITLWMDVATPVSWLVSKSGLAIAGIAITSVVAYMMFFHTIKIAGPVFASQCAYIVTLSGVLWGILIFSEAHTIWVWLSVVVMMAGLALVTPRQRTKRLFSGAAVGESP